MESGSDLGGSEKGGSGEEKSGLELERSQEKSASELEKSSQKSGLGEEKSRSELTESEKLGSGESMDKCDPLALEEKMSDRSREFRSPDVTSKALIKAMAKMSKDSRKNHFSKKNSDLAHPFNANDDTSIQYPSPETDQVVLKPDTPVGTIGKDSD
jgi:hypothetical protein